MKTELSIMTYGTTLRVTDEQGKWTINSEIYPTDIMVEVCSINDAPTRENHHTITLEELCKQAGYRS